ncbi:hypothetical protein AC579_1260 [Pseudocercospora musae]|uniref:Uncharacterized protein n=1 Tax=Pseudocercospora musae TaxID=113226 RepID=A0A139I7H4_9PEZI|nr:hypothetical protein AC579_1260 [Pseudocercospora musae]
MSMDSMHELQEATADLSISDDHSQKSRKPLLKTSRNETELNTKARKRVQFSEKLEEHREIPTRWETLSERINLKPLHDSAISDHELSSFHGHVKAPDTPPPWHIEHVESKMSWDSDDGLLLETEHDPLTSTKELIPAPRFGHGHISRTASLLSLRTAQAVSTNVPLPSNLHPQTASRSGRHVVRRRQHNTQHGLQSTQERKTSRMYALRARRFVHQPGAHQSPRRLSQIGHFQSGMTQKLPAAMLRTTVQRSFSPSNLVVSKRDNMTSTQSRSESKLPSFAAAEGVDPGLEALDDDERILAVPHPSRYKNSPRLKFGRDRDIDGRDAPNDSCHTEHLDDNSTIAQHRPTMSYNTTGVDVLDSMSYADLEVMKERLDTFRQRIILLQNARSAIFKLPAELRNKIFLFAMQAELLDRRQRGKQASFEEPAFVQTSRQIKAECTGLWYSDVLCWEELLDGPPDLDIEKDLISHVEHGAIKAWRRLEMDELIVI